MKKMPTLFVRDPDDRAHVLRDVTPGCEWVLRGEGVATRKIDGTCCLVKGGELFARREVKRGKHAPEGFVLADVDHVTGKTVGWVPVTGAKEYARHLEAFAFWPQTHDPAQIPDGTYELVGPGVNGNPENAPCHMLVPHGIELLPDDVPRDYDGLRAYLLAQPEDERKFEGIVWHRDPARRDGEMVKLKRKDFRA